MTETREQYITDSATQLAAELLRRGNLLGCDTATVLLAASVEQLQGELAEAWAEAERAVEQERRAVVAYLEQQADLALSVDKPIAARVLQAIAYEIEAGFHAMIDA